MRSTIFIWFLLVFFVTSCQELAEDYLGIPMQPHFIDSTNYKNVMNLFGVIRPGSSVFPGNSFVCLVKALPTKGDTTSDIFIDNANLTLYQMDSSGKTDTIYMQYEPSPTDTTWHIPQYISPSIKANSGYHYKIGIRHPNYPTLTGETTMPSKPELEEGSLVANTASISFKIKPDTTAYLYDVYLLSATSSLYKRIVPVRSIPTDVEINYPFVEWDFLVIYAYDRNLSIYYSTSTNSFFSFNTYRPAISTVQGGLGCFGSLNLLEVKLR